MRPSPANLTLIAALLALVSGAAHAYPCYVIMDKSDAVIYRDQQPPVDMSAQGAPQREQLRQRGHYLLFTDVDRCQPIRAASASGRPMTADEILAETAILPAYGTVAPGGGATSGSRGVYAPAAASSGDAPSATPISRARGAGAPAAAR